MSSAFSGARFLVSLRCNPDISAHACFTRGLAVTDPARMVRNTKNKHEDEMTGQRTERSHEKLPENKSWDTGDEGAAHHLLQVSTCRLVA